MAETERDLWWYRALHGLTFSAIREATDGYGSSIVDAGCGTGGLLLHLREGGYGNLRGFDLSDAAVAYCRERGLDVLQEDLRNLGAVFAGQRLDVIVSNDTLYFLTASERRAFFGQCRELLRPGGIVVCNVPALRAFRGTHDLAVGIRQRFSRDDIRAMISQSQFEVLRYMFWPFFLSPLIFLGRVRQRMMLRANLVKEIRSDVKMPPALLNRALLKICELENAILPRRPFGSSLFLVLRRL